MFSGQKVVAVFTGHRDILSDDIKHIESATDAMCERADEFVFGGAIGGDTIALNALTHRVVLGKRIPKPIIIVPDTIDQQPVSARQAIMNAVNVAGGELIELRLGYNADALRRRNHAMIDRVDLHDHGYLVAYWSGRFRSGTYSAISYAKKKGLQIEYVKYSSQ